MNKLFEKNTTVRKERDNKLLTVDKSLLYNGALSNGNTIIIGRQQTGKTAYVERCVRNGLFPGVEELYWVSPFLNTKRKRELAHTFRGYRLYFYNSNTVEELEQSIAQITSVITIAMNKASGNNSDSDSDDDNIDSEFDTDYVNDSNNNFVVNNIGENGERLDSSDFNGGEAIAINRLLVFDDQSTIADRSTVFANFMTRSRKFGFCTVSIFHDISTTKGVWASINSNAHRFILFQTGTTGNILKFLSEFQLFDRHSNDGIRYNSKKNNWLTNLYSSQVNTVGNHILIDTYCANNNALNNGSMIGYVRTVTGGKKDRKTGKYRFDQQYIHQNNAKGNHLTFKSERVTSNDQDFLRQNSDNIALFLVIEKIGFTEGGQSLRTRKINEEVFPSFVNQKRKAEEIDNIHDSLNQTESFYEKNQAGGSTNNNVTNLPLYLQDGKNTTKYSRLPDV